MNAATQPGSSCGVPTLYYDELSPQVRSCYMLIKVLDIEVDLQPIILSNGEDSSESYRKINPSNTLPTLVDGQYILSDGHTIMIYLCDKYAGVNLPYLWPRDYLTRLNVLNMLFYEGCVLYRRYSHLLTEILLKKYPNMDMSYHQAKVIDCYNSLETNLMGQSSMTGNSLSIADLSIITTLSSLDLMFPISPDQWPNLHRWFENLKNMDCYKCNDDGLQELSHLLEIEGQFPVPSTLKLQPTTAMQSSKDKLNSLNFKQNPGLPWIEKSSLREKFFKKFSKDNDRLPTNETLRKSQSPSKGDIISVLSEGHTKKKFPTFLPRIRTSKFRVSPSSIDHEAQSSPQLKKLHENSPNKELRDNEVESGVEDCTSKRNTNTHYKTPSDCLHCSTSVILKKSNMEWSCMDCIQERLQNAEC